MRPWHDSRRPSTACMCERAFCEELEYNLLYCWFLDMDLMERSFGATVFTKNRPRLLAHDAGRALFDEVVWAADEE